MTVNELDRAEQAIHQSLAWAQRKRLTWPPERMARFLRLAIGLAVDHPGLDLCWQLDELWRDGHILAERI